MHVTDGGVERIGGTALGAGIIGAMIAALLVAGAPATAAEHTFNRGIAGACTAYAQTLDRFPDVAPDGVHAAAIDCLAHWDIVQGRTVPDGDPVYAPADAVDRAAMGSYVARTLTRLPPVTVPAPSEDRFPDYPTTAHADNVHILRAAGIVEGRTDGTYGPGDAVTRAQMASYIARMLEFVIEEDLPLDDAVVPAFPDATGTHQTSIDKLASIGVVTGRTDRTYGPGEPVTRAAMASFVARSMDYLAFRGYLPVPFEVAVEAAADAAPHNLNQRITGTVDDQFAMGYFSAEVRFEVYRDGVLVLTASRLSGSAVTWSSVPTPAPPRATSTTSQPASSVRTRPPSTTCPSASAATTSIRWRTDG
jgi:hypothetical protein